MPVYQIRTEQFIPSSLEEVWAFISAPSNLNRITPPAMGFKITTPDLPWKIYPGMMISYRVRPLAGIAMTWVTEITHMEEQHYFVDEQRVGPYALWHHEHFITQDGEGVRMEDIVTYKLPLGILGSVAHSLFVKRQLEAIFEYRKNALVKIFGPDKK